MISKSQPARRVSTFIVDAIRKKDFVDSLELSLLLGIEGRLGLFAFDLPDFLFLSQAVHPVAPRSRKYTSAAAGGRRRR